MIVDLHSHYVPLDAVQAALGEQVQVQAGADSGRRLTIGGQTLPLARELTDVPGLIALADRQGLDRRILAVPPFCFLYELPPDLGVRWARALNDGIAAAQRAHPDRLVGFATVPLQDVPAAVAELERAASELGLRGVEIASNLNGVELDATALDPFWAAAERRHLPILIHPHYVAGANRMGEYHLRNLIGNPTDTALAGARLMFGGVLERFPDLRIILSHGGGSLAHLVGRLRHGWEVRPEAKLRARAPIEGLRRLYYDTIVFDPVVLRHLVELVGASQVVLGTDFPFDMAEERPVEFVGRAGLSNAEVETILHGGAELLG